MGYEKAEDFPPEDAEESEKTKWVFSRKATVELTQYVTIVLYLPRYIQWNP